MIEISNLSFRYREGAEPILHGIDLAIPDGSFVGITGAAGSGKSTLTYAFNGIIPHCYPGDFYGGVTIDGLDTCEASLTDISRLVGSVCQDIDSQMVSSVVEDEMLYGLENFSVPKDQVEGRIAEALEAMGISNLRHRGIAELSGGQKQKVAVASVIALKPRVLVLDEPTAELDPTSSLAVFELLARYARENGTTVIVVEQKIALLSDFADMLLIVDGGKVRFQGAPAEVLEHSDELLEVGVNCPQLGEPVACTGPGGCAGGAQRRRGGRGVQAGFKRGRGFGMIEFKNVSASYDGELPILRDVGFLIPDGDFVAFVGTNGAGKSTTMRLINGLLKPSSGQVLIDGAPTTQLRTSQLAAKVGFLFQNPDRQICCSTVREELLFGFRAQGRSDAEAEVKVDAMIERFGFDGDAEPFLLNRGTRQLLALASIIVMEPPVVVLDEPTTGLDFRECAKVMDVIAELNARGTTVVMVCHDMEVVADYAKRVIAMTAGQVVADGETFAVLRDRDVLARTHLLPPQMVDVSLRLVEDGAVAAASPVALADTLDEMADALASAAGACERTGAR